MKKPRQPITACHLSPLIQSELSLSCVCSFTLVVCACATRSSFQPKKQRRVAIPAGFNHVEWVHRLSHPCHNSTQLNKPLQLVHMLKLTLNTLIGHGLIKVIDPTRTSVEYQYLFLSWLAKEIKFLEWIGFGKGWTIF